MKLGLVCISELLKQQNKSLAFKSMTRSQFLKGDRERNILELSQRCLHNCNLVHTILQHCLSHGIKHYRISSSLFPLVSDTSLSLQLIDLPHWSQMSAILAQAGDFARENDISVSMHPDQFNVLVSYNSSVVDRSINELNHQSSILDMMGYKQDLSNPMCLHLNCKPRLEEESLDAYRNRFLQNLARCSSGVRARLVLENEDKGYWNCERLYDIFGEVRALVYDNLHDACNPSFENMALAFADTWGEFRPIFHWSEGINGGRSHCDYASHIPKIVEELAERVTWEVELKAKDRAICSILASRG